MCIQELVSLEGVKNIFRREEGNLSLFSLYKIKLKCYLSSTEVQRSLASDRVSPLLLFFLIFIVIQLQLYAFSPHPSTPPQPNPPQKKKANKI